MRLSHVMYHCCRWRIKSTWTFWRRAWNAWRHDNNTIALKGAGLSGANLGDANLSEAVIRGANLHGASL